MNIQIEHRYKIYSPLGVYLGTLQGVSSPFGYNQNIATTFAQMQVTVEQSPDVTALQNEPITDESGNVITDETGSPLLTESQYDVWGSLNSKALMVNNNLIRVYEYSSYYPSGLKVFDGYISKVKGTFGANDDILLTCLSNGTDMNNILVQSGDTSAITQNTDDGSFFNISTGASSPWLLQSFQPSSVFQISAVSLELTATVAAQLQVLVKQVVGTTPSPANDPIVASGSVTVPIQTKTITKISFSQPSTLNPAYLYYIQMYWNDSSSLSVFAKAGLPYGGGYVYTMGSSGTSFSDPVAQPGYSLYFTVWQYGGNITGQFTNEDPSLILTQVLSNYTSQSGIIVPPVATLNAVASQPVGDTSLGGAVWSTAFMQKVSPTSNITMDSLRVKLQQGASAFSGFYGLFTGNPANDSVVVTAGNGVYTLGGGNAQVSLPAILSTTVNPNNGLATVRFANSFTLNAGTNYYFVFFYNQQSYNTPLLGASTADATVAAPFGQLYSVLCVFNNSGFSAAVAAGVQALYLVLGLGIGTSPNGGYSSTGNITSYTFKMQTVQQAVAAIFSLAPANWYWYVDPATGELKFAQASTVADLKFIRGKHVNVLEIEATKENIKNVGYFTGGDDGTGTSTNILVKQTTAQGSNRIGLAQFADNRVNSTSGGVVAARLIALNYLNNNAAETYITSITILATTMDLNLIKLGMMVKIVGYGAFVDGLLLQVVGINRSPDQIQLQLGTLPLRDAKVIQQLQSQLAYQQTVANPSVAS